ncbi:LutC/YkgG family protein [Actibacterium sp. XHP0104]|uniref:LutC/YkgG family protein n=1 Tax=Actibacterium sp. XHP0104 TaxID=2984335 RepID=UPI0021E81B28|nr:LUD domain-containing protein [Actibacterium sp. XHP0104]MCV2880402.1 LUD domain-containing protein [Actibacterium sp. XHP0104]
MSTARDAIFQAISTANGAPRDADTIAAEAMALIATPDVLRPGFTGQDNLDRFIEKATSERVTATVSHAATLAEVPGQVADYLTRVGLGAQIALQPRAALRDLDWGSVSVHHTVDANEPVAVSIADLAVAETGSVVFLSGPDAPVLLTFLPLHHVVVVGQGQIRRHLEDVFEFVGAGQASQPRNLNIVTGTSGTADIEAKNIRGAHGPRFMHIICVADL